MGKINKKKKVDNLDTDEEIDSEKELTGVAKIIDLLDIKISLLRDQFGMSYAYINSGNGNLMSLDSAEFDNWLFDYMFTDEKTTISQFDLNAVKKILKHRTLTQRQTTLYVRVAWLGDRIIYDLGNANYVDISAIGWSIRSPNMVPPLFKKFSHQKEQIVPVTEGKLDSFLELINLPDPDQRLLLQVYLVAAFIPRFAHPVLMVYGPQGSAKTTMCSLIKDLVDPSVLETSGLENEGNTVELIQSASHHWLLCLDNLSHIPEKVSNTISRICTGGGLSKRMLYQNDSDFIYNFQHLIVLNGIDQVIKKPDLLDRAILIGLERISDEKRATAHDIRAKFEQIKPQLLGAIFNILVQAMKEYPTIQLNQMPRMADFAKWGCAITKAMGKGQNDFLNAYEANVLRQQDEAIEGSPVAFVVMRYMETNPYVNLSATELYSKLSPIAETFRLTNSGGWPKDGALLSRRLTELSPNLKARGIIFNRSKGSHGRRIVLQRVTEDSRTDTPLTLSQIEAIFNGPNDGMDGKDSNLQQENKLI